MAYEVLARKWRPQTFYDMVGQGHVLRALTHALDNDRLHQAYLFTGSRGVGKTTVARILARALNCEQGVSSKPCGECEACQAILEGRFFDLLEIDAASRTGVDDMRELLESVEYAPVAGRFKVYLIDEVHMLSVASFNALLKTLEEPPPHIVFLLATTDPKKVPVTVLSRCLQFHLKNLLPEQITEQLQRVLGQEGVEFDPPALELLARAADGSMRDALSLTDQAISYCGGRIAEAAVAEMLGTVRREDVSALLDAIVADDGKRLLALSDELAVLGADFALVLDEMARALHRAMLIQVIEGGPGGENAPGDAMIGDLAGRISPEVVQLYYQLVTDGRAALEQAPDPKVGFEVTLLRMLAFRPVDAGSLTAPPAAAAPADEGSVAGNDVAGQAEGGAVQAGGASATGIIESWYEVLDGVALEGVVRSVLERCVPGDEADGRLGLVLDAQFAPLLQEEHAAMIGQALSARLGRSLEVVIAPGEPLQETPAARRARLEAERLAEARAALESDPLVQNLMATFNATLAEDSIRPV